ADHLHRDPLGDARADEIADGGPAEIVEDAAGHPSRATRRRPGLVETSNRRAVRAGEDVRDDASELPFALPRDRASPPEQRAKPGREREDAASPVFVVPGSSRTSAASKATFVQRRRAASDRHRQPVVWRNETKSARSGDSRRRTASNSSASKNPRRTLSSRRSGMCGRDASVAA